MAEGSSLINLGNLGEISKPATVLIEKIANAVTGYFRPHQIRRVAQAEAEAEIIKVQSQIKVTQLQRRALARFVAEEGRKQNNIEQITRKAIPQLTESSNPQNIEDDWIVNFFDKCRIISDDEMQSLWASVLAGEANSPGTYSKRTVNFLNSLDKSDASLFTALCGFGWQINNVVPLIFDTQHPIYNDKGIDFNSLQHLESIGLISFNNIAHFQRLHLPKKMMAYYYGNLLNVEFNQETDNRLGLGTTFLTQIGAQLAPICGSTPVDGFQDYVMERWCQAGLILSSPYPRLTVSVAT